MELSASAIVADLPGWFARAACRSDGVDRRIFFSVEPEDVAAARVVCAVCPVKGDCLAHALRHIWEEGVWGGLTHRERRQLARSRR